MASVLSTIFLKRWNSNLYKVNYKEINLDAFCVERVIELSAIDLTDRSLVVVSVYRPPDGDLNDFFDQFEGCLGCLIRPRPNTRLIFCGDFNVHL
ncbi:hypothetical protein J6590_056338 [Homalodisca vitripennis]|nr:hypothetical protein J6590_056338 [Homalodisca vitripennis]